MPVRNNTSCFVMDGRMSMRASGDTHDAVANFYRMLEAAMNGDAATDGDSMHENLYYYKAVEENNIISSGNEDRLSHRTTMMILIMLSVGVFSLTVIVMYFLCCRAINIRESRQRMPSSQVDGRLGISALNYLGSQWLEVKSTSSGSSCSSKTSSKLSSKTKFPQVVGESNESICCSSVSELSVQTLETSRVSKSNTDLEKIDEEALSIGELKMKKDMSALTPIKSIRSINTRDINEDSVDDGSSKIVKGSCLDELGNSYPSSPENQSFFTSVESPPLVNKIVDDNV